MIQTTPHEFILKPKIPSITFEGYSHKFFSRVVIQDDIFNIYPYMEVHVNDAGGVIIDGAISGEGLEYTSKFGSNQSGYEGWLETEWVWRNNEATYVQVGDTLGGTVGMGFLHKYEAIDYAKTRAWDDTISNIVKDIILKDYNLKDSSKIFVTETTGKKIRQQADLTNSGFLETLVRRAYTSSQEYAPFVTFFNSAGEFYFCTADDLFKIGQRVDSNPFIIKAEVTSATDKYTIKKIDSISTLGVFKNKPNYKIKLFKFDNMSQSSEITDISNHVLNDKRGNRILINKDFKSQFTYSAQGNYGLYTKDKDFEDYKGFRNAQYRTNLFNIRMNCMVQFHPNIVAGRIMTLDVSSLLPDKGNKSKEYSGDWIVMNSKLFFDTDGVPYSVVELGKRSVTPDANYALDKIME